ncbi:hypothetical protein H5410_006424 [Solanum commersonii]|uniref:Disease resistance R13L4/SHOC-2-like LRR domain-containing protein n=1 Tax=Solanum commersonii TaxID=4109 RepID=A0A9J6A944_SOLCO|nr:hypothetical protein H5410_006424 [Solanum commersonii]
MIKGSIPQELGRLRNLSKLECFYLHENDLEGEIPDEIGDLTNLRLLSFRGNDSIPASIFTILEHLFLDSNRITGKIPVSLSNASKITHLFFTENDVQGNIPNEFGKLHELVWFEFEYNRISGAIPSSLFNISSLEILKARHNYLNGHLPYDLGTWLPNLQEIFLSHNQFSGDLPAAICNASKLENLEVANNSFTGPIPMMLGNLVDLITLNLQNNLLENNPGATRLDFLNSLVTSRNLVYLILESNPLNGIFTESIGNLSSNIRVLDAFDCGIRGSMPTNIGNLSGLIFLGLASNNIVGNVPPSFVGLQNLERLYLTGNKLEGTFPAELCSIGRLGLLHLGENRLSGETLWSTDLYIPICPAQGSKTTRKKSIILRTAVPVAVTFLILVKKKTSCINGHLSPLDILDADLVSDIGFTIDENQSQIKQLLVLIINVAVLCLKELPEERINMREVVVQLNKITAELTKLLTQIPFKI